MVAMLKPSDGVSVSKLLAQYIRGFGTPINKTTITMVHK